MLITLAVLRLVEPFARRSERLESDNYVNAVFVTVLPYRMVITYPAVTKNCLRFELKGKKKSKRTIKDALNIDIKYVIPSFLWEIVERATPS